MSAPKTLYELLGVTRDAKAHEIGLAYQRLSNTMEKESSIPDARRAARMREAYEKLSDPARRAEYDAALADDVQSDGVRRHRERTIALVAAVVLAAGAAGYWFLLRTPARDARGADTLAARELLEAVGSHVARLEGALVSGEVRDLGMAVDVGDGEMIAPCRGIVAGMTLAVKQDKFRAQAEVTRANPDLDVCTLGVKAARGGVALRRGLPSPGEKLQAVLVAGAQVEARPVSVTPTRDATGALEVRAAATLPPGTPIFDAQARLVAIVAGGPGAAGGPVAWDAAHIARARETH